MLKVAASPPALDPSPPTSTPISTLPKSLQITSSVKIKSSLIVPDIAHTVLPAIAVSVVTPNAVGHDPVKTVPLTATICVVAVGAPI